MNAEARIPCDSYSVQASCSLLHYLMCTILYFIDKNITKTEEGIVFINSFFMLFLVFAEILHLFCIALYCIVSVLLKFGLLIIVLVLFDNDPEKV